MFRASWSDAHLKITEVDGEFGAEYVIADADRLLVRCAVRPLAYEAKDYGVSLHEELRAEVD
jgi:hypothetical protein